MEKLKKDFIKKKEIIGKRKEKLIIVIGEIIRKLERKEKESNEIGKKEKKWNWIGNIDNLKDIRLINN